MSINLKLNSPAKCALIDVQIINVNVLSVGDILWCIISSLYSCDVTVHTPSDSYTAEPLSALHCVPAVQVAGFYNHKL